MKNLHKRVLACTLGFIATLAAVNVAAAQSFPERPIQVYVGFPAGGGADIIARFYTDRMQAILKQPVIIQNRPGANGNIAAEAVARAKPDGYTLLAGPSAPMAGGHFLYANMPVDAMVDYAMVAPLNELGFALAVKKDSPINSVKELTEFLKNKPKSLFASSNSMSLASSYLYLYQAKLKSENTPYKATADAVRDLNAGDVDFMFVDGPFAVAQANNGNLKLLAVTTTYRAPGAESVPTMREAGFPDYEITGWFMALAPAKTPAPIIAKLNEAITTISKTAEAKEFFGKVGSIPLVDTPEGASKKLAEDRKQWGIIAKAGNIKPQ